jgi:hypothetical protein
MPGGRPSKKKHVKEEETCLSLSFPQKVACCHCIRSQPEQCEKAWEKDPLSDEEIQAYIDAWLILSKMGFLFPNKYRTIKKRNKWKAYIIAYDELLKNYQPSPYQSLPNPSRVMTRQTRSSKIPSHNIGLSS